MTVTIKSIGGAGLYVAQNAADVRAALVEAVSKGADLGEAYLRGADLGGAYLRGAALGGAYLRGADLGEAYLRGADLGGADLRGADLGGADLGGADLGGAYLGGAYLGGADLGGADLGGADLGGAYLRGANGFDPRRCNDLLMLLDQPGAIRAYKMVTADYLSPIQPTGQLDYHVGNVVEVPNASTDANVQCAVGINVATLPWIYANWQDGCRVVVVEFTTTDIAAIPVGDGKFRLRRCTVVGEKDVVDLGLATTAPVETPAITKRTRKAASA